MRTLAGSAANLAGWLSRRLGRGGGTTLPGVVLLKLRPNAIAEYSRGLEQGNVLISATNGKTTTTRLLAAGATKTGHNIVTNAEGSNLERGVAAALLKRSATAELGIFEVDEAALSAVAVATEPRVIVLMNLFRDQLDRYGELESLVERWQALLTKTDSVDGPPTLVLNADDPNIADLGRGRDDVVWFGIEDRRYGVEELDHAADATTCRQCGSTLEHSLVLLGHQGHWHCPTGDSTRPEPTVAVTGVDLHDSGQAVTISYPAATSANGSVTIESPLSGLHNTYNIVAAFAALVALGRRTDRALGADKIARALGETKPAFGRGETVKVGDKAISLLLAKNPTGVNQNVRTITSREGDLDVLVLLNDRTADGQDVSWIWDVDWERLQPRLRSLTLGGDRAWDLALRFRYGGFEMSDVGVEPNIADALDTALRRVQSGATLHALPTYTAMLDLRSVLTERGLAEAYWEDA